MTDILQNAWNTLSSSISSNHNFPLTQVKSQVDGQTYMVRDLPDKQQAADLIANVRKKITQLYTYLKDKFPDKPQVRHWVQNFTPEPRRFLEATPDAKETSYTVNKGERVHLCLRQRQGQNESLVQENVMVFVSLHEMAHAITPSKYASHGPEFWNNFGWLLKQAEQLGIYKYQNFKAQPVSYCGMEITDSPAYDPNKDGTQFH